MEVLYKYANNVNSGDFEYIKILKNYLNGLFKRLLVFNISLNHELVPIVLTFC